MTAREGGPDAAHDGGLAAEPAVVTSIDSGAQGETARDVLRRVLGDPNLDIVYPRVGTGGWIDELAMRVIDILMSIPPLVLALLLISALGSNSVLVVLTVAFLFAPRVARIVRASTLAIVTEDYVTAAVTRGVCRWLDDQGFAALTEFKLANRRRADVVGLSATGSILMVEVKSTPEDFRGDAKWLEYLPYCDAFAFAVPAHFPWQILPEQCGVIVADHHAAMVVRTSPHHPVASARRRSRESQRSSSVRCSPRSVE